MFAASCLMATALGASLSGGAPAAAQTAAEPLSKTCRVTRADDVELQKIEPFKVFDNRVPKRDMVVKDGDTLTVGNQTLKFHQLPGHTPGVLMTEGILVYDGGTPYKAVVPAGAAGGPGLAGAEQGVKNANKLAAIQGVQVNLQIHSWAEPTGYPGGGVLERAVLLKNRKSGDPHPFVDPATWNQRAKAAQEDAAKTLAAERTKAAAAK